MKANGNALLGMRSAWSIAAVVWMAAHLATSAMGADYVDGVKALNASSGSDAEKRSNAIVLWRKAAWQDDDFLAAMALANTYNDDNPYRLRSGDPAAGADFGRFYDRVEAYVWYFLAVHSERFSKYVFAGAGQKEIAGKLEYAGMKAGELFLLMSEAERAEAKNRVTYILSCRGSDGFIRLAMIQDDDPGSETDPDVQPLNSNFKEIRGKLKVQDSDLQQASGIEAKQVFGTDRFSALMYLYIAQLRGSHIAGQIFAEKATRDSRRRPIPEQIVERIKLDARRWVPPFEFYPRGAATYPHTDECVRSVEEQQKLRRLAEYVDPAEVRQALWFLQFLHGDAGAGSEKLSRAIGDFQDALLRERTGRLAPEEMLRLLQMAAVNGHIPSQVRLGVLYARGEALRPDYERAANWFEAAAKQRDGQAMYYLGEMIKKNYVIQDGSANAAAAVSFYVQASLAGYGPTREKFRDLLDAGPCQSCEQKRRLAPRSKGKLSEPSSTPVVRPPYGKPLGPPKPVEPPAPAAGSKPPST